MKYTRQWEQLREEEILCAIGATQRGSPNTAPARCIYMRICISISLMTKVISLSEKAYGTLKKLKREDESFSDVVLRLSEEEKRESILRFSGGWKGDDIDEVFGIIKKDRKRATSREVKI